MSLLKNFINDPHNFESSIKNILDAGRPDQFNKEFLSENGFKESSAILYVNLFMSLGLLDEDGQPNDDYDRLISSESDSRIVIAEKVWQKYSDLFAQEQHIHTLPIEKIKEIFKKVCGSDHSDTFINLMSSTFKALVDYGDMQARKKIAVLETVANGEHKNGSAHKDSDLEIEDNKNITSIFKDPESEQAISDEDHKIDDDILEEMVEKDIKEESETQDSKAHTEEVNEAPETEIREEEINETRESGDQSKEINESQDTKQETEKLNENQESNVQTKELSKAPVSETEIATEDTIATQTLTDQSKTKKPESNGDKEIPNAHLPKVLLKKAALLQKLNRTNEAIKALDQIIEYFDHSDNPDRDEVVSQTLLRKSEILEASGQEEAALQACEEYIKRFHKAE